MCVLVVATAVACVAAAAPPAVTLQRTSTHPMRYHLALPTGWTREKAWPVVLVIPDASRAFASNLRAFVAARGSRPFLLVAPEVLSCGGAISRTADHYSLSSAEWDSIRTGDDFAFDDAGLGAVLADVRERWGGDARAFLTGWEAGGHTVWAQALRRPERWRAVAPVSPNYAGRGLDSTTFSRAPERATLPIQVFRCGAPTGEAATAVRYTDQQTTRALAEARAHGLTPSPVRVVRGADHGPLPGAVLAWFGTIPRR
jgi:hypothetical protein